MHLKTNKHLKNYDKNKDLIKIKKKYSNNAQLLFTDTDSLTCHIKAEDVYGDFY